MEPLTDPFTAPSSKRLAVFGHPAHELAVYGLLQRHAPQIIVITDGGGPVRIEQSKAGLEKIGLRDHVTYLNFSESSFYDALLDSKSDLFFRVAEALRGEIERVNPDQIFCDAIEFYNPVHDITRPILLNALNGNRGPALYEIPLVYQKPGGEEAYAIQRVPPEQAHLRFQYDLSKPELDSKVHARDHIYANLREQAGPEFLATTPAYLSREEIADANGPLPDAENSGRVLRYEWRAKLLEQRGLIPEAITYRGHFLPAVEKLAAQAG